MHIELYIGVQEELQVCIRDSLFKTYKRRSLLKQGYALHLPFKYWEIVSAASKKETETSPYFEFADNDLEQNVVFNFDIEFKLMC